MFKQRSAQLFPLNHIFVYLMKIMYMVTQGRLKKNERLIKPKGQSRMDNPDIMETLGT